MKNITRKVLQNIGEAVHQKVYDQTLKDPWETICRHVKVPIRLNILSQLWFPVYDCVEDLTRCKI